MPRRRAWPTAPSRGSSRTSRPGARPRTGNRCDAPADVEQERHHAAEGDEPRYERREPRRAEDEREADRGDGDDQPGGGAHRAAAAAPWRSRIHWWWSFPEVQLVADSRHADRDRARRPSLARRVGQQDVVPGSADSSSVTTYGLRSGTMISTARLVGDARALAALHRAAVRLGDGDRDPGQRGPAGCAS